MISVLNNSAKLVTSTTGCSINTVERSRGFLILKTSRISLGIFLETSLKDHSLAAVYCAMILCNDEYWSVFVGSS